MTLAEWEKAFESIGQRSKMRKRGKKIDVLTIKEGAQIHKVELRFDRETGEFIAELGSVEFNCKKLEEIKKNLQAKAKELVDYVFKWYIVIKYNVEYTDPGSNNNWSSHSAFEDIEFDRHVLCGLDFRFNVVERSQAIKTDETDYRNKPYYMVLQRDIDENDNGVLEAGADEKHTPLEFTEGDEFDSDDERFVEFTPERYAKLKAIREALTELARRLNEVVGKSTANATKMLDSMPAQPLMLAAPREQS